MQARRIAVAVPHRGDARALVVDAFRTAMSLRGKRVVVLVEDGYEDLELWYPYYRLLEEGAQVLLAGHDKRIHSSKHGYPCETEQKVSDLEASEVDAVIIPGGVAGPDRMRRHKDVIDLVRKVGQDGRLVAAICHAAWVPISAELVKGRLMTSFFSVRDDCVNAGAKWVDKEVVVDGNLVTSRDPDDLPAFCQAIIKALES
jgi:protease I